MTIGEINLTDHVLELRDRTQELETAYKHVSETINSINEQLAEGRQDRKELVSKVDGIQTEVTKIVTQVATSRQMRIRDWAVIAGVAGVVSTLVALAGFLVSEFS